MFVSSADSLHSLVLDGETECEDPVRKYLGRAVRDALFALKPIWSTVKSLEIRDWEARCFEAFCDTAEVLPALFSGIEKLSLFRCEMFLADAERFRFSPTSISVSDWEWPSKVPVSLGWAFEGAPACALLAKVEDIVIDLTLCPTRRERSAFMNADEEYLLVGDGQIPEALQFAGFLMEVGKRHGKWTRLRCSIKAADDSADVSSTSTRRRRMSRCQTTVGTRVAALATPTLRVISSFACHTISCASHTLLGCES